MKELFVTPELAKLLKDKGYVEECMAQYQIALTSKKDKENGYSGSFGWKKGEVTFDRSYFVNNSPHDYSNSSWLGCAAPLWQQVIDWLFFKHGKDIPYSPNKEYLEETLTKVISKL